MCMGLNMSDEEHECSICGGEFNGENGRLAFIGGVLIKIGPWCISPIMEMFKDQIIGDFIEDLPDALRIEIEKHSSE